MSAFRLTYRGTATEDGFDMAIIGESMIGFNLLLKDFYKASGIDGELQVKTVSVKQGCVVVDGLLIAELTSRLIENPSIFLEALKHVNLSLWQQTGDYLSTIGNADKSINDFFRERPFTSEVIAGIIASTPALLLAWWLDREKSKSTDLRITRLEQRISSLQQRKRFNRALSPLQENGYDSITYVSKTATTQREVLINDSDLGAILPEDDKVLSEYENGVRFSATGEIKSLSFARGERVGITFHRVEFGSRTYTAFPDDNHTTASYRNLYGEAVTGEFEVYRKSMFKVPEFKIISLDKLQTELAIEDGI